MDAAETQTTAGKATTDVLDVHNSLHDESANGNIGNKACDVHYVEASIEESLRAAEVRVRQLDVLVKQHSGRLDVLEGIVGILEGTVTRDWIRNVASSILLFLAGEQPYEETTNSTTYQTGQVGARILLYLDASIWDPEKFKKAANDIINRRNGEAYMHPASVEDLDRLVQTAQDAVGRCPSIRHALPQEVLIIDDYDEIKKHFPAVGDDTMDGAFRREAPTSEAIPGDDATKSGS